MRSRCTALEAAASRLTRSRWRRSRNVLRNLVDVLRRRNVLRSMPSSQTVHHCTMWESASRVPSSTSPEGAQLAVGALSVTCVRQVRGNGVYWPGAKKNNASGSESQSQLSSIGLRDVVVSGIDCDLRRNSPRGFRAAGFFVCLFGFFFVF